MKQAISIILLSLWCGIWHAPMLSAQSFYEGYPSKQMYVPTQNGEVDAFALNPAVIPTPKNKISGYVLRHNKSSAFTLPDDTRTTTESQITQESYGAAAIADLGAGTAAGLSLERSFTKSNMTVTNVTRVPYEIMTMQTVSARVLIDLAPGLEAGLLLRWTTEKGDILGSTGADIINDRILYSGTLISHGGGAAFTIDKLRLGAAYFPASRGKADILYEQRIITEPGFAVIDGKFNIDKHSVGVSLERSVHRRDERGGAVLSEDGERNVALDGISPNKNLMNTQTIHVSFDAQISSQWGFRGAVSQRKSEFVFDDLALPAGDGDMMSALDIKVSALIYKPLNLTAGYAVSNYSTTLTNKSGSSRNGATFKGAEKAMFLNVGFVQ